MKLSLRDLIWTVFLCAIGIAWFLDHRDLEAISQESLKAKKAAADELQVTTELMLEARSIARLQLKVLKDCGHDPYIVGHDWLLDDSQQTNADSPP